MKTKVDEDDDGYAKMPEPNEVSSFAFRDLSLFWANINLLLCIFADVIIIV